MCVLLVKDTKLQILSLVKKKLLYQCLVTKEFKLEKNQLPNIVLVK